MADRLGITAHTVRDHIKALFSKVGAHTRAELLARIFAEHYFDRLEADVDRMDEGPA
jgi:DNA-binding CsgD family transcriptional regulator